MVYPTYFVTDKIRVVCKHNVEEQLGTFDTTAGLYLRLAFMKIGHGILGAIIPFAVAQITITIDAGMAHGLRRRGCQSCALLRVPIEPFDTPLA